MSTTIIKKCDLCGAELDKRRWGALRDINKINHHVVINDLAEVRGIPCDWPNKNYENYANYDCCAGCLSDILNEVV